MTEADHRDAAGMLRTTRNALTTLLTTTGRRGFLQSKAHRRIAQALRQIEALRSELEEQLFADLDPERQGDRCKELTSLYYGSGDVK